MTAVEDFISHLSEQPWSNYTAADYSVEQWHKACLIHLHDGPPTSKGQCKLPVKTPAGVVNRSACHSAAAALAGARGGVHASAEQKASASRALVSLYHQMDEKPPASLMNHSNTDDGTEFIEHYGKKGMRWGVRKKAQYQQSTESKRVSKIVGKSKEHSTHSLTNKQLEEANKRFSLEKKYAEHMPPSNRKKLTEGHKFVKELIGVGVTMGTVYGYSKTANGKKIMSMLSGKDMKAAKAAKLAKKTAHFKPAQRFARTKITGQGRLF